MRATVAVLIFLRNIAFCCWQTRSTRTRSTTQAQATALTPQHSLCSDASVYLARNVKCDIVETVFRFFAVRDRFAVAHTQRCAKTRVCVRVCICVRWCVFILCFFLTNEHEQKSAQAGRIRARCLCTGLQRTMVCGKLNLIGRLLLYHCNKTTSPSAVSSLCVCARECCSFVCCAVGFFRALVCLFFRVSAHTHTHTHARRRRDCVCASSQSWRAQPLAGQLRHTFQSGDF